MLVNFLSGGYRPRKHRVLSAGCGGAGFEPLGFGTVFTQSWEGVPLLPRSPEKGKYTPEGSPDPSLGKPSLGCSHPWLRLIRVLESAGSRPGPQLHRGRQDQSVSSGRERAG